MTGFDCCKACRFAAMKSGSFTRSWSSLGGPESPDLFGERYPCLIGDGSRQLKLKGGLFCRIGSKPALVLKGSVGVFGAIPFSNVLSFDCVSISDSLDLECMSIRLEVRDPRIGSRLWIL